MAFDLGGVRALQAGQIVEQLRGMGATDRGDGRALHRVEGRHGILRRLHGNVIVDSVLRIEPLIWRHLTA